jgi:hypothetical protein
MPAMPPATAAPGMMKMTATRSEPAAAMVPASERRGRLARYERGAEGDRSQQYVGFFHRIFPFNARLCALSN